MVRIFRRVLVLLVAVAASCLGERCQAARPSEELLPDTTKGYLCIPDMDKLRKSWEATQLGQLARDPLMKPFAEDLERQLRSKLSQTDARVGLTWEDLQGVCGGELCLAVVQPWDREAERKAIQEASARAAAQAQAAKKTAQQMASLRRQAEEAARKEQESKRQERHAMVMLANVSGHVAQAKALLEKIAAKLIERGATRGTAKVAGLEMVVFTIPADKPQQAARQALYCLHDDVFLATDSPQLAAEIVPRFAGKASGSLAQLPAYQATMARSREAFTKITAQVRWFVEPFGLAEVIRAYGGGRKKRGTDLLKVLGNQGFRAIQGVGGCLALATGEHELLHRTVVYAPPVQRPAGSSDPRRYDLAAAMLDFPNSQALQPQTWAPRELATYLSFNWKLQAAFRYSETLVNEIAGDEVFQDVLQSIETDPNGPQINIEKELVAHLGERVTLMADCRLPVTPKSERVLVAVESTNPEVVMRTVNKAMESDPQARKLEHNGHVIWEMVNEQAAEVEAVKIDGLALGDEETEPSEEEKRFRPNAAVTVAQGHLLVATHVDYIVEFLDRAADAETLEADGEYQLVAVALDKLGAGADSFRFFSRTDEAYRATYELIRQGKMPEAETLLGKLLNRIYEPEEEGVPRKQYVDGSKLPDFQVVRRYLGPAGLFSRTEQDGWSVTGCVLSKEAP